MLVARCSAALRLDGAGRSDRLRAGCRRRPSTSPCRAVATPGTGSLVQTPVYRPILDVPGNAGIRRCTMALTPPARRALHPGPGRLMAARHRPHAHVHPLQPAQPGGPRLHRGTSWRRWPSFCLQHDLIISRTRSTATCSSPARSTCPSPSLAPGARQRARSPSWRRARPSTSPGWLRSFAVIPDPDLRRRLQAGDRGRSCSAASISSASRRPWPPIATASEWLTECLRYLEANRDFLADIRGRTSARHHA